MKIFPFAEDAFHTEHCGAFFNHCNDKVDVVGEHSLEEQEFFFLLCRLLPERDVKLVFGMRASTAVN